MDRRAAQAGRGGGGLVTLRIAALGAWHVHADEYAQRVARHPGAAIAAVWDDDHARGRAWAERLGAAWVDDLGRVLADPGIDGVVVCAATSRHRELIVAAARASKHVFTEKVLAATDAEAAEIAAALRAAGVRFAISFPHRSMPLHLQAKRILDEGLLGRVTALRYRNAHNGASKGWLPEHFYDPVACGGGAMIDLGCHGMYLTAWLLGMPRTVAATFTRCSGRAVEDNAVAVMAYDDGRIAVNETSFVSFGSPMSLEIAGTEGCLLIGGPDQQARLRSKLLGDGGAGWTTLADPPPALPHPIDQWLDAIAGAGTIAYGIDEALALTRLMDAAYRSWRQQGMAVQVAPG